MVRLCHQVHQSCKFGEISTKGLHDIALTKLIMHIWMDNGKTYSLRRLIASEA